MVSTPQRPPLRSASAAGRAAASGTAKRDRGVGLPQIPATLLRAGHQHPGIRVGRPMFNRARPHPLSYRASPTRRERDFSLLSALVAFFLGLFLVGAGLYGLFLGLSQQEAVPALAPGDHGGEEIMDLTGEATTPPTWRDRLRGLVWPGMRLVARELWTWDLATALPGLRRSGPDPETLLDGEEGQLGGSPPGDHGIRRWLAALTGIDVSSPASILQHTLPGFRAAGGGHASLSASRLPARGGIGLGAVIGDNEVVGAGGEWPPPEAIPSSFMTGSAGQAFLATPSGGLAVPAQPDAGSAVSASRTSAARDGEANSTPSAAAETGSGTPRPATGGGEGSREDDYRAPLVLIYHTHTAESYHAPGRQAEKDHYEWNSINSGVVQVGKEIASALRAAGIPVVHAVRVNDYPEFRRAYSNSRQLVREYLQKYPSIVVALDIHRDGKEYSPDAVSSDGERIARVAFVVGTNTTALANPHWGKNLAFAQELHQALQKLHPGVSRGIMLREDARFNQDLLPRLLVVEVGTYTNELAEARAAGRLLGRALATIINRR